MFWRVRKVKNPGKTGVCLQYLPLNDLTRKSGARTTFASATVTGCFRGLFQNNAAFRRESRQPGKE
jgi:hypothetical protein